jgi:hypothetical protein
MANCARCKRADAPLVRMDDVLLCLDCAQLLGKLPPPKEREDKK